jgi:hypothetical protein
VYLTGAVNQRTTSSESSLGLPSTTTYTTTLPPISWSYQGLTSAVLNSSEVNPHIAGAYYHFIARYGVTPAGNGTQLFADVYVVGAQTVAVTGRPDTT